MFLLLARLISVRKGQISQGWSEAMMAKSLQENSVITKGGDAPDVKSLREARGLTREDISQATKISVKNLEAMENYEFHRLPPPVYTRAYFKAYARLLGVDEEQIAGRYEKNLAVSAQAVEEETEEVSERRSYFSRKVIVNAVIVLVLCVLGFLIYSYFNFQIADVAVDAFLPMKSHDKSAADVKSSAATANTATAVTGDGVRGAGNNSPEKEVLPTAAISAPATVKSETTKALQNQAPIVKPPTLIITAREKTWLKITEDRKDAYERLMEPGERMERSALQYEIDIGNAGGISVQFQENILKPLGKSGEVVHLHLP
jgi:cytoskeleton protein RodZ